MPREDSRHYLIDGEKVVRVSTVLNVIAKPGLMMWYGKHGTDECRRLSRIATDFGTRFHKAMEQHALGRLAPWDVDEDIRPHVEAAVEWFDANVLEVHAIEHRVHSRVHGYAGTADLIARVRGISEKRCIPLDWKTSKECGWEYGLQLSAYLEAARERQAVDFYADERVVLRAPRELPGVFEVHRFPADEHEQDFVAFLNALNLWRRVDVLERRQRAEWARRKRLKIAAGGLRTA